MSYKAPEFIEKIISEMAFIDYSCNDTGEIFSFIDCKITLCPYKGSHAVTICGNDKNSAYAVVEFMFDGVKIYIYFSECKKIILAEIMTKLGMDTKFVERNYNILVTAHQKMEWKKNA